MAAGGRFADGRRIGKERDAGRTARAPHAKTQFYPTRGIFLRNGCAWGARAARSSVRTSGFVGELAIPYRHPDQSK
ncbi:hypothetical protein C7S17_3082 [Burkholderia thailandensis]|nr:hypothetical protein [Burkholderia thailandensis]